MAPLRGVAAVWWLLVLVGVLGIAAGVVILVVPAIGLVTLAVVAGIFLLIDGAFELLASLLGGVPERGLLALVGVVTAIIGILLVRHPIAGVVATALLLGFWLIAFGIIRVVEWFSGEEREWPSLLVAVVEIVAGIVIASVADIAVATLAALVGIAFIVRGLATCWLAWNLRTLRGDATGGAA
jgi:uncharacterized membrane protein HdeD (DUF308 family)